MATKKPSSPAKRDSLRREGALNPHPQTVTDLLFQGSDFFDRDDLIQVKYELLRRVEIDKQPVSQAASAFGLSRPTGAIRLRRERLGRFAPAEAWPPASAQTHGRGVGFHLPSSSRRSGTTSRCYGQSGPRALRRDGSSSQHRTGAGPTGKKTPLNGSRNVPVAGDSIVAGYEDLRHHALHSPAASYGLGWGVLVRQGMAVWMKLCAESLTARPKTEASRPAAEAVLPCYVRSEMVQILTAMALGCWQEAKA